MQGRGGELVLRRRGPHLEVISNGAFLISTENEASSRALVSAAAPWLPDGPLRVLIGGLGLGYALDEALGLDRVEIRDGGRVRARHRVVVRALRSGRARRAASRRPRPHRDRRRARRFCARRPRLTTSSVSTQTMGPNGSSASPNAVLYDVGGLALTFAALRPAAWPSSGHRSATRSSRRRSPLGSRRFMRCRRPTSWRVAVSSTRCTWRGAPRPRHASGGWIRQESVGHRPFKPDRPASAVSRSPRTSPALAGPPAVYSLLTMYAIVVPARRLAGPSPWMPSSLRDCPVAGVAHANRIEYRAQDDAI